MVPAGKKTKRFLSVNYTTKTIHQLGSKYASDWEVAINVGRSQTACGYNLQLQAGAEEVLKAGSNYKRPCL